MFKNLFSKKSSGDGSPEMNASKLSPKLKALVEQSRLQIMTHQLFMHYDSGSAVEDPNNPSWQNQAVYFWKHDEPFEKKSLPPEFKEYAKRYFIFNEVPAGYSLQSGEAIPWFGMPGGGTKYFVASNGNPVSIPALVANNIVRTTELIALTENNSEVLNKTDEYFFLMDQERIQFRNGKFFFEEKEIEFSDAYEKGCLVVVRFSSQ